jgi:hypothetical protein
MIETISQAFAAGEVKTFTMSGNYFELIDAPSGGVEVILSDRSGAQLVSMRNIGAGYFVRPGPYEVVQIRSTGAQTISFFVADGDAGTRRLSGSVSVVDSVSLTNAAATVTSGGGSLLAANASRRYLLVQNKDLVGRIWINFGAAATQANGLLLVPGGSFELDAKVSQQQIFAIGDLASNANVVTCEG